MTWGSKGKAFGKGVKIGLKKFGVPILKTAGAIFGAYKPATGKVLSGIGSFIDNVIED